MRASQGRLIRALLCCFLVALVPAPARAQGFILPRPPVCAPPPCLPNASCVAPRCVILVRPEIARSSSRVHVELADRVLRYEVTETFVNRGGRLGEADYLFPLPTGAAFQDLQLSINGELVAGEVLDASQARGVYEEIVRRQRDPGLVEWMGMGLLRARIFPIAPGEEKTVVVRFQTVAPREGDAVRIDYLRPGAACAVRAACALVSVPGPVVARSGDDAGTGAAESRDEFTLTYRPSEGYGKPYSPTQSLEVHEEGRDQASVRIAGQNPDITILLPMARTRAAAVTMLPFAPGDEPGFALITVTPPALRTTTPTPRDVTFVLDVSGSMAGRKIEQARAAGRDLLATLSPADRFRLIDFSTDVRTFRDEYEYATPEHIREADRYLDELEADGATNIEGALRRALSPPDEDSAGPASSDANRLRLVLFITDGEPTIGEQSPDALVALASSHLGHARLFTFGLGADVNTSLLEQLALQDRGTAQFVRPDESVERAVSLVTHRLVDPVITDLALHVDGVHLTEMMPENLADLFAGQDLVLLARYHGSGPSQLHFTGRTASGPVNWTSAVTFPERERANPFVARLWATQRIGYLEAARHKGGPSAEVDDELRSLGERFGIPTELTSYLVREPAVAVGGPVPMDRRMGMAPGASLRKGALRLETQVVTGTAMTRGSQNAANATGVVTDEGVQQVPAPTLENSLSASAPQAPAAAFVQAKVAAAERAATTLAGADSVALTSEAERRGTLALRHAGDRAFVLRDSVWTDTRFHPGVRVVRVRAYSAAYFALLQSLPDLKDAFAIAERVLVAGKQVAVEVTPVGAAQLSDSDVAAVRAGW